MGLNFEFTTPTRVIFGCGSMEKLPQLIGKNPKRILLVTGRNHQRAKQINDLLANQGSIVFHYVTDREPTLAMVSEGTEMARANNCELAIALGGGSAIDCGKAISAMATNKGDITEYLEVIGAGKELESQPLPFIAIPTTAGTGAEVTKNAVIHSPEHRVKVSLRSTMMFPSVALVDPELTLSMPPEITAISGMDALSHLLETFVCNQPNPMIDALCREALRRVAISLRQAYANGNDVEARTNMSMASMLGGMALANVKLGAVHGFAAPLGGMFPIPHGASCAVLLPAVTAVNIREVKVRGLSESVARYDELAQILTRNSLAKAGDGVEWLKDTVAYLKIPSLANYGITPSDFPALTGKAKNASSMKGNPVVLNDFQLNEILENSF